VAIGILLLAEAKKKLQQFEWLLRVCVDKHQLVGVSVKLLQLVCVSIKIKSFNKYLNFLIIHNIFVGEITQYVYHVLNSLSSQRKAQE
jgi:hypothetical protein